MWWTNKLEKLELTYYFVEIYLYNIKLYVISLCLKAPVASAFLSTINSMFISFPFLSGLKCYILYEIIACQAP